MSPRKKSISPMEIMLLGFLREKPMHGYDLFKVIKQPGGLSEIWRINQSNLYAMLDSLEKDGYLVSHLIQIGNSPTRKEYHITAAGSLLFEQWMKEPVLHGRDMRQVFLAKLFFAVQDNSDTALSLVKKQKSISEAWLAEMKAALHNLSVEDQYAQLVYDSRIRQISAWMDWLNACEQSQIVNRRVSAAS